MENKQLEVDMGVELEEKEIVRCPLSLANSSYLDNCLKKQCAWYITDDGKEECAMVKLAKGWCM